MVTCDFVYTTATTLDKIVAPTVKDYYTKDPEFSTVTAPYGQLSTILTVDSV
jgi:hypothetical protein